MYREESTQHWQKFYATNRLSVQRRVEGVVNKFFLNSFQRVLYNELVFRVQTLLQSRDTVYLLSAGSGIDYVAYHLRKKFGSRVVIALLDVSPICLEQNETLFGDAFTYVCGDIFTFDFSSVFDRTFDVIYNTGLLEHFTSSEQKKIIFSISSSLSPDGNFVTLNPHTAGKIYVRSMALAQEKGVWPFGREEPILTLRAFATRHFSLVSEYPCCSLGQLVFLLYSHKLLFLFLLPFVFFGRYTLFFDAYFGRKYGYYGLVSVFVKHS